MAHTTVRFLSEGKHTKRHGVWHLQELSNLILAALERLNSEAECDIGEPVYSTAVPKLSWLIAFVSVFAFVR